MANDHDYGRFTMAFRVVCWIATLLVMSYWILRYSLNQDISRIEYKKYYEKSSDVYPVLSLCLKNSFSKTKLQMTSQVLNETLYRQYLKGDYFSPKFMEVDYDDIRLNLSDFIDKYYFVWRNGSSSMHDFEKEPMKIFLPSFLAFGKLSFTIAMLYKHLMIFIWFNLRFLFEVQYFLMALGPQTMICLSFYIIPINY